MRLAKKKPVGVCENCDKLMSLTHTTRKTPRLFCCDLCRATYVSRATADRRSEKMAERVRRGLWDQPSEIRKPDPVVLSASARIRATEAVASGKWVSPSSTTAARQKMSMPRKHKGNPNLHEAISRLSSGERVSDLEDAQAEEHRAYRRALYAARKAA
jgi:hypothetical protein